VKTAITGRYQKSDKKLIFSGGLVNSKKLTLSVKPAYAFLFGHVLKTIYTDLQFLADFREDNLNRFQ